jgi:hypothetical protein
LSLQQLCFQDITCSLFRRSATYTTLLERLGCGNRQAAVTSHTALRQHWQQQLTAAGCEQHEQNQKVDKEVCTEESKGHSTVQAQTTLQETWAEGRS